jgi:UDP-N-acetylglucosamine 2-epimerase (non-hydrolysing)
MILIIYGTRPEFIKVKSLIDELTLEKIPFKTLFTGQHKDLVTFKADFNLKITNNVNNRLDNIINNCTFILDEWFEGIEYVLVQGDTTSVLGLALTAFNRGIKVIHLEAGLRTYDNKNPYPEEMNRQLVSRIADINLCPTNNNSFNLINERVMGKSYVVGNTGLDNLLKYKLNCEYNNKILVTLHRRENHNKIQDWFKTINQLAVDNPEYEFILPVHPNPNVKKYISILTNVKVINPLPHDELIELLIKCSLIITDSGGLQEECSFFNKKCLVCRETTERPESLNMTSFLIENPNKLKEAFNHHIDNKIVNFECPFGDGKASKKIVKILNEIL